MHVNFTPIGTAALWLCIIGAINWGLVAVGFNLVAAITGGAVWLEALIYGLVGIAGVYLAIEAVMRSIKREPARGHVQRTA